MSSAAPPSLKWPAVVACAALLTGCSSSEQDPPAHARPGGSDVALEQGQSGSENVPEEHNPVQASYRSCPCGFQGRAWLKASVVQVVAQEIELQLDEVLFGEVELQVGDAFAGEYYGSLFCGGSVCQNLAPGDAVLAAYRPTNPAKPECAAYDACLDTCRAALSASAPADRPVADTCPMSCETDTTAECPAVPAIDPTRASLGVVRWEDPLVLARTAEAELTLALDRVSSLWGEIKQCEAQWPAQFYELQGYPTPYYSIAAKEIVFFPSKPKCH